MFQTGVEYNNSKYYLPLLGTGITTRSSVFYANTIFSFNTISIPFYFNLLLAKTKLAIGIGPSLDFIPYTYVAGNIETWQFGVTGPKFSDSKSNFTRKMDAGLAFKIAYFLRIKTANFVIESKLKYGISNLLLKSLDTDSHLHNTYATLMIGYVFKN